MSGNLKILDLFAGCGGLSLGFEAVGFETIGYEMDKAACETYNKNLNGACYERKLEVGFEYPQADIVIGGPPCQPFSVWGYQKGVADSRNGFPIFIDAIEQLNPSILLIEAGATSDMQRIRLNDGRRRRLLHREAARLQSFPDWFDFCGNDTKRFNQIGNAVPPLLAYRLALSVKKYFDDGVFYSREKILDENYFPNMEECPLFQV